MPPRPTRRYRTRVALIAPVLVLTGGLAVTAPAEATPSAAPAARPYAEVMQQVIPQQDTDAAAEGQTAPVPPPSPAPETPDASDASDGMLAGTGAPGSIVAMVTGLTFLGLGAIAVAVTAGKRRKYEG